MRVVAYPVWKPADSRHPMRPQSVYRAPPRAMWPRDGSAQLHLPPTTLGHSRPNSSDLCDQAVCRGRTDRRSRKSGDCLGVPHRSSWRSASRRRRTRLPVNRRPAQYRDRAGSVQVMSRTHRCQPGRESVAGIEHPRTPPGGLSCGECQRPRGRVEPAAAAMRRGSPPGI
jgi:hypothetical protein